MGRHSRAAMDYPFGRELRPRFQTVAPHVEIHAFTHLARMREDSPANRFSVQAGQQVVRDGEGTALFLVTKGRWSVRLFGIELPDTTRSAMRGRPLSDLLGHPLLAPGTPCGEVPVQSVVAPDQRMASVGDSWSEEIKLRRPMPAFDLAVMPMVRRLGDDYHFDNGVVPPCLRAIEH